MTFWICKILKAHGQYRLTIPKALVKQNWIRNESHVYLNDKEKDKIIIGRLKINGEKATDGKNDTSRED